MKKWKAYLGIIFVSAALLSTTIALTNASVQANTLSPGSLGAGTVAQNPNTGISMALVVGMLFILALSVIISYVATSRSEGAQVAVEPFSYGWMTVG